MYLYSYFWGSIYVHKPRNSIQKVSLAKVSLCDFSLSIQIKWEFTGYGLQENTELSILSFHFTLTGRGEVLRPSWCTHAALPLPATAADSHFPVFLHSERRKSGNCSFTAALIGGKAAFPVFLLSERRKSGNGSFTAVPIGGKAAISSLPPLWEEENLKCRIRCGCIWRKSFNPILYPFFPSFACWSVMGRGLVPQNGGWPCVTDNWVEKISIHNKS